jgi:mannose-6-phosphate isomerase-like protein (cupin superfamily)
VTRTAGQDASLAPFAFDVVRVDKPWGHELIWALSEDYCGKALFVRAEQQLSLQYHRTKDETIYVQSGCAEIEIAAGANENPAVEVVEAGRAFRIRPGIVHRMRALEDTVFLEASTPQLDDVVRLEDLYGRCLGRDHASAEA